MQRRYTKGSHVGIAKKRGATFRPAMPTLVPRGHREVTLALSEGKGEAPERLAIKAVRKLNDLLAIF